MISDTKAENAEKKKGFMNSIWISDTKRLQSFRKRLH